MPSSASSGASSRSISRAIPGLNSISGPAHGGSGPRRRMSTMALMLAAPDVCASTARAPAPAQLSSGRGGLQVRQSLRRGGPAQGFARAGVELGGHRDQLLKAVHPQVGALGKVLAQQPVGGLVARPLPRA